VFLWLSESLEIPELVRAFSFDEYQIFRVNGLEEAKIESWKDKSASFDGDGVRLAILVQPGQYRC
jgi:hypothetical protein